MTERDALAAKHFPEAWAEAQSIGKSKTRQKLRQAAERKQIVDDLRIAGAQCSTCEAYIESIPGMPGEKACNADSDFHGWAIVKPSGLCWRYERKGDE